MDAIASRPDSARRAEAALRATLWGAHTHVAIVASVIGLAATLRVALTIMGWPPINSDESTMGLMAMHIAFNGERPIFFYGQSYMGALEAYLAAALMRLFGVSVLTLRLPLIVMFALFQVSAYWLTRLLFDRTAALLSIILLSLGSTEIFVPELMAIGGYPETLLFGTTLLMFAVWLARSPTPHALGSRWWWRTIVYSVWGLVAGLAIWSDLLVLPFIIMAALLLLVCRWRELLGGKGLVLVLCMAIGALPLIMYNVTAPPGMNSWSTLQRIEAPPSPDIHLHLVQQIAGTLLISLPNATGFTPICRTNPSASWPISSHASPQIVHCMVLRGIWSAGFLALWIAAALRSLGALGRLWPRRLSGARLGDANELASRQAGRLAVLGVAGLTIVLYIHSAAAELTPWPSARYLFGVLIALPVMLFSTWRTFVPTTPHTVGSGHLIRAFQNGALAVVVAVYLAGAVLVIQSVPGAVHENQQQRALVAELTRLGATQIYSEYWTCDRIVFESHEHIICAVLNDDLTTGFDRYLPYRAMVEASPRLVYAFPIGSPQALAFAKIPLHSGTHYERLVFDGYIVWVSVGAIHR